MAREWSIAEARTNLPKLVRDAESGTVVELTRRGRPVAVLLGWTEYGRLTAGSQGFSEAYDNFRREVDLRQLAIDPDEVFGTARDRTPGRGVIL